MTEKPNAGCCSGQSSTKIQAPSCCPRPTGHSADLPLISIEACPMPTEPGAEGSSCRPRDHWVKGFTHTPSGEIPLIETTLAVRDIAGSWKARWGINRLNYTVTPGLYGVGNPDAGSPVLVTANYKMTFDRLRKELGGLDAWVLVLDTYGINVWCAAGKRTFGTDELVKRIDLAGLNKLVSHSTLILPQLGAPGVAAHEVKKRTGFKVVYGPVRARDIKEFLKAGMKATKKMRTVSFGFMDRLILTPIELTGMWKPVVLIMACLFIAHVTGLLPVTFSALYPFIGALLAGAVVAPALLPWIPGPAFSWKGWLVGVGWTMVVLALQRSFFQPLGTLNALALLFLLPAISAFLTLNFTGASTYTSLSGVKREMRVAVPATVVLASVGIGLWVAGLVV
jgi:hypothetical protein